MLAILTSLHHGKYTSHTSILKTCSGLQCNRHTHTHTQTNEKPQCWCKLKQWLEVEAKYSDLSLLLSLAVVWFWHVWKHKWNLASQAFQFLGFIIQLRDDVIPYTPSFWAMRVVCKSSVWPSCSTAMWMLTLFTSKFLLCYLTDLYLCLVIPTQEKKKIRNVWFFLSVWKKLDAYSSKCYNGTGFHQLNRIKIPPVFFCWFFLILQI